MNTFDELCKEYYTDVRKFVLKLTGNYHNAEDVTQETFLRAFKNFHLFTIGSCFKSWIFQIAYCTYIDICRKKPSAVHISLEKENQEGDCLKDILFENKKESIIDYEAVALAIEDLSFCQRQIFKLYYIDDLKQREIAEILGKTIDCVGNTIFKGKKNFKKNYHKITGE